MFGLHSILVSLNKTQRSIDELVPIPHEVGSSNVPTWPADKTVFYSSPYERPYALKCPTSTCDQKSGRANDKQLEWIAKLLEKHPLDSSSHQRIPLETSPDIPTWQRPPVLAEYLLKPLFIWHPENQFGITIAKEECPVCKKQGFLKAKEYTVPRHVHCLTTDAYLVSVRYICERKMGGCGKSFVVHDEDILSKSSLVPPSIFLKCPYQLFSKSGWTTDLIQSMFDLVSGRAKVNDFIVMVQNARTSEYMKTACAYRDHIQYYSKLLLRRDHLTSTTSSPTLYPDFPDFFKHCEGYNDTFGPSKAIVPRVFALIVKQQKQFFDRYEGGLLGTHLSADHHHNVPGRMQEKDTFNSQKFAPINGLHTVMNERHQFISHRWTHTTSNKERLAIAEDLVKRYRDRNVDTNDIVMYLDKCCDDSAWLAPFPNIRVFLDNHHLITRYRDNSNGTHRARHDLFMSKIANIIAGSSQLVKMRPGPLIYSELTQFLNAFEESEKNKTPSTRVVTSRTRECHNTQAKHFQNYITESDTALVTIQDRFCRPIGRRGSGKNENRWQHMRAVFPEICSIGFGDHLMTVAVASWNFNREMHYDPRWEYLPISPMHIVLTQYIARMPQDALMTTDGVSSMFQCLPLAIDDCSNNFGFCQSYVMALPILPVIPQHFHEGVGQMTRSIVDHALWESYTLDAVVHQAVDIASSGNISSSPTLGNASTSGINREDDTVRQPTTDADIAAARLPHPIVTGKKRKRKAPLSHVRSTETTHKKKGGSMNALGNRRISPLESLQIWDSVMGLSPLFNPLERRVLRFLALRYVLPEPIETLSQFPIKTFHFPVMDRLWHVFVSGIKVSDFEFKHYLRPKSGQILKQQLEDMVAMTNFNMTFKENSKSQTMVSTLQNSANKLAQMVQTPVLRAWHTVTTTVTRTEVVEAEILLPYAPDPMDTEAPNTVATSPMIEAPPDVELPVRHNPSPDEFLFSIVEKEMKDNAGRIRWKDSVVPQWNSWQIERHISNPMTSKQLKNRYRYMLTHPKAQISTNPTLVVESAPPLVPTSCGPMNTPSITLLTPLPSTIVQVDDPVDDHPSIELNVQERVAVENVNDRLMGTAEPDIPSSSNAYLPPGPSRVPEWNLITSAQVPQAPSRCPYSARESALFTYLLNDPLEKLKYHSNRNTTDWKRFSERWAHLCRVETALGSSDFKLRTKDQLKQKKKDDANSSKS